MTAGFVLLITAQITVRGTVLAAETHEPLGFSIVALYPGFGQRFTDAGGTFVFDSARPGTYLLSVRQIGYAPLDTQIVIGDDSATGIDLVLHRLAIELPPVTVAARQCTSPGAPDSSDAALRAIFDQLQENARRLELLADSFPFDYTLERVTRTINQRGDTGPPVTSHLRFSSRDDRRHPYAVGRVVERAWGAWGNGDSLVVIHTAGLEDLGSPAFVANHCFSLAGLDTVGGETFLRINFEPALRIRWADMAGAAFLDTATYAVRYTKTAVTRPDRSSMRRDVLSMTFRTRFREIAPHIPLPDSATVLTKYRFNGGAEIDWQRTTEIRFRHALPPATPKVAP
jgi:hypothetical protein